MTARFRALRAALVAVGLGLGAPTLAAPPPDRPEDCGLDPAAAPDFALVDVNPTSPSYGSTVPRTSAPGRVTLLYFALPSCSHCQAQVEQLQAIVRERDSAWAEVDVRIIALAASEESVPELADGTDLPILQDTPELDVQEQYNADRWYIYLLDRGGVPRTVHYKLDLERQQERLFAEVQQLLDEAAP